ncbi:alpha/beta hydrolase [Chitinimonas lacunae]|uniref:Alpha/beta hydrolase n=1 Tax=Chitinimonas lacunae TaxID=1963018 RepID=A0ABV8MKG5_9NEIS
MTTALLASPRKSTNVRKDIVLGSIRFAIDLLNRTSPMLATAWVARRFLTPGRVDWPIAEQPWRDNARRGWLMTVGLPRDQWNFQPMRTYRWGEARRGRIALMHGWGGRATQFYALIPLLVERGYEVVAIDAPAHGESAGRLSSIVHVVHALQRLIRSVGPVDGLVAHSLGGAAAVNALAAGLPVSRVVLVAPSADLVAYSHQVARLLGFDEDLRARVQNRIETEFGIRWDELTVPPLVARLRQPGLVIHDRDDRELPPQVGESIAKAWPGARFELTEGLGHNRILRDPLVLERITTFVTS